MDFNCKHFFFTKSLVNNFIIVYYLIKLGFLYLVLKKNFLFIFQTRIIELELIAVRVQNFQCIDFPFAFFCLKLEETHAK